MEAGVLSSRARRSEEVFSTPRNKEEEGSASVAAHAESRSESDCVAQLFAHGAATLSTRRAIAESAESAFQSDADLALSSLTPISNAELRQQDSSSLGPTEQNPIKQSASDQPAAADFWRQMLLGSSPPLDTVQPLEFAPVVSCQTSPGDQQLFVDVTNRAACNVSMQAVVNVAWALTLHVRNGGEDESVVFGVSQYLCDTTAAAYASTLPIRVPLLQTSVSELLDTVHTVTQKMACNTTMNQIEDWTGVEPRYRTAVLSGQQCEAETVASMRQNGLVLALWFLERSDVLELSVSNDADRVGSSDADMLLRTVARAVQALLDEQQQQHTIESLVQHIRMGACERQISLERWNAVAAPIEASYTVHSLLEAQCLFCAHNTAITYQAEHISYSALEQKTAALATQLRYRVCRDSIVGLCVTKSVEEVCGILGIVRANAAYVPLDPKLPTQRLTYLVHQSGSNTIVAQRRHLSTAAALISQSNVIVAEDAMAQQERLSAASSAKGDADWLIYCLFTSGSTGRPKGVMVEHGSLYAFLTGFQADFCVKSNHTVPYWHLFTGDPCVNSVWCTLTCGACLMVATVGANLDFACMQRMLNAANCVPFLLIVPPVLSAFLDFFEGKLPASIQSLYVAGDKSTPELAQKALLQNTTIRYVNGYGPSEVSVNTHHFMLYHQDLTSLVGESIPIGRLMLNTTAFVLDKLKRETAVNIAGELVLGNAKLARGYAGRPDLTAAAFESVRGLDGSRLYRTGDRARWKHNDGSMEFVGRVDFQIKLNGQRVEAGEVESIIRQVEEVDEALLSVQTTAAGTMQLVAYVVPQTVSSDAVSKRCRDALPEYMVPSVVAVLSAWPLNPYGKVDRKALPSINQQATQSAATVAWSSRTEATIAEACIKILKLSPTQLRPQTCWLQLGLTSLLAAACAAQLQKAGLAGLSAATILKSPSVAALSVLVSTKENCTVQFSEIASAMAHSKAGAKLSAQQHQMWVIYEMDRSSVSYISPGIRLLKGQLDCKLMLEALHAVASVQHILRTKFGYGDNNQPTQWVCPLSDCEIPLLQFTQPDLASGLAVLQTQLQTPFELEKPSLVRLIVVHIADESHLVGLVQHHIITDGLSYGLLWQSMTNAYNDLLEGKLPQVPAPAVQYADYADWQGRYLDNDQLVQDKMLFWKQALGCAPALLLQTDKSRPHTLSGDGASFAIDVDNLTTHNLSQMCGSHGCTQMQSIFALWALTLCKHSGQSSVVVGLPYANRNRLELEGLIGYFVNTLPVLVNTTGSESITDLVSETRHAVLEALEYSELPFTLIVEALREMSGTAMYQTMVVWADEGGWTQGAQLKGLQQVELDGIFDLVPGRSTFEIELHMRPRCGALHGCVSYSTDLFEASSIQRLGVRFQCLTETLARAPTTPIEQQKAPLGLQEQRLVMNYWNSCATPYDAHKAATQLVRDQATNTPDAVALVFFGESLTYRETIEQSGIIVQSLLQYGAVRIDSIVGLCVNKSFEEVFGMLGIMMAGAAYVPLDPNLPVQRLQYLVEQCKVSVVATQDAHAAALGELKGCEMLLLDRLSDQTAEQQNAPEEAVNHQSLAYVLFTSGSTGKPKGVMVEHGSLALFVVASNNEHLFGPDDRFLYSIAFTFDPSVMVVWCALACGARLVIAKHDALLDSAYLRALMLDEGVTFFDWAPSVLRAYLEIEGPLPETLRVVFVGGEACSPQLAQRMVREHDRVNFWNIYGPAEVTITTHGFKCGVHDNNQGQTEFNFGPHSVPIGPLVGNTSSFILDETQAHLSCPIGVAGELYLGGPKVARGYIGRPELTGGAFGYALADGAGRVYKTGDRARWLPNGCLDFLGRVDFQVKLNGQRIEVGEIEVVICQAEGVHEAVVTVRQGPSGAKMLVAYTMPQVGNAKQLCRQQLPEFMLPAVFVGVKEWPLNAAGKVDRKSLPEPALWSSTAGLAIDFVAAEAGTVEASVCAVYALVLRVAQVGLHNGFFEMGGDSIQAIRAVSAARDRGIEFTAAELMRWQTAAALARVCRANRIVIEGIEQATVEGGVMLTYIQRWFFEQQFLQPHHWNQSISFTHSTHVDQQQLAAALTTLQNHHDMLRCRYVQSSEGVWSQRISAIESSSAPLCHVVDAGSTDEVQQKLSELNASLDLQAGPVWCAALILEHGQKERVVLVFHHLVIDAVSWRILEDDLNRAYKQQPLPPKSCSFQKWSEQLHQFLDVQSSWSLEIDRLHVDAQVVPSERKQFRQQSIFIELPPTLTNRLLGPCGAAAFRTRPQELMLAALLVAHAHWCGSGSLCVQMEGHGRDAFDPSFDVSRTIGWFTVLWPVKLQLKQVENWESDAVWAEAICSVKEELRTVPSHVRQYGSSSQEMLPDLLFNYLGQLGGAGEGEVAGDAFSLDMGKQVGEAHSAESHSTARLALNGYVFGGSLTMEWGFDEEEYEKQTVERFANEWFTALERVVAVGSNTALKQWTPSDFPLCELPRNAFESVIRQLPEGHQVLAMSKLTSLQSGVVLGTLGSATAYVVQSVSLICGKVDLNRLRKAWEDVAQAHDVLRTRILVAQTPHPVQVVLEGAGPYIGWHCVDMTQDTRAAAACALEIAATEREASFTFEMEPLFRLTFVRGPNGILHQIQTSHHSILDGWSDALLRQDVMTAYHGGTLPQSPPFYNVVERMLNPDYNKQKKFWLCQLDGIESCNELMLTAPPVETQGPGTCSRRTALTAEAARAAAAALHVTVASVANAAWALVLRCLSGDKGVLFGVVSSGRSAGGDSESTVGLMINTLPMHVQIPATGSVREWLQDVQGQYVNMISFESTSLRDIQKWTGVCPLVETSVDFVNYPTADNKDNNNLFELKVIDLVEKRDLLLSLDVIVTQVVELHMLYDETRVAPADATAALDAAHRALEWLLDPAHCELPLREAVEYVGGAQYQQILERWNDSAAAYNANESAAQMFERVASTRSQTVALRFDVQTISYATLFVKSGALARHLVHNSAAIDSVVGLYVQKGIEEVLGMVGIMRAGSAYVPLDPKFPQHRIEFLAAQCESQLIVAQEMHAANLDGASMGCLVVTLNAQQSIDCESSIELSICEHQTLAYVLFTSGSTGKPKGVMVEHGSLALFVVATNNEHLFGPDDRFLYSIAFTFDPSVLVVWCALACGARLVIAKHDALLDSGYLRALMLDEGVTFFDWTPSVLRAYLEIEGSFPGSLRAVFMTGEALSPQLAQQMLQSSPEVNFWNTYGPAEATIVSHAFECRSVNCELGDDSCASWRYNFEELKPSCPIGAVVGNTTSFVLSTSESSDPLPIGVAGELYLGGPKVARGYIGRPELTRGSFREQVSLPEMAGRVYKTGDRARWMPNGCLDFLGRVDFQVKLNGQRIEVGEIEVVICQAEGVHEAVVTVRQGPSGAKMLVAYVKHLGSCTQQWRDACTQELPAYMVPAVFVGMEEWPLNAAGKVDRKQLHDPDWETSALQESTDRPAAGSVEERICSVFEQVLCLDQVGVNSGFFTMGGDSIKAMKASSVASKFGLKLRSTDLMKHQTPAALAGVVQILVEQTVQVAESFKPMPVLMEMVGAAGPTFPLSEIQMAYVMAEELITGLDGIHPHNYFEFMFADTTFDMSVCNKVMQHALSVYPVLRTHLIETDTALEWCTLDASSEPVVGYQPAIKTVGTDPNSYWKEFREHNDSQVRLNQDRGFPAFLMTVHITADPSEVVLTVNLPHALASPTQLTPIFKNIMAGIASGSTTGLSSNCPVTPAEYQLLMHQLPGTQLYEQSKEYWMSRVQTLPLPPELPLINPIGDSQYKIYDVQTPCVKLEQLHKASRAQQLTSSAVFLGVFAAVIADVCGTNHFTIGNLTMWSHPQAQDFDVVGPTRSQNLLEIKIIQGDTWQQFLDRVQAQLWTDIEHLFFDTLLFLRELRQQRKSDFVVGVQSPGLASGAGDATSRPAKEARYFSGQLAHILIDAFCIDGELSYAVANVIDQGMAQQMLNEHARVLTELVHDCTAWDKPVCVRVGQPPAEPNDLCMVVPSEWLFQPVCRALLLHTDKVAIQSGAFSTEDGTVVADEPLSYKQVAELVVHVAQQLLDVVQSAHSRLDPWAPKDRCEQSVLVGIVMSKGWEQVVAAVAVTLAGCAYLPISAQYPASRIHKVMQLGGVQVALTQPKYEELRDEWGADLRVLVVSRSFKSASTVMTGHNDRLLQMTNPPRNPTQCDLAYVIFTSGSTGEPKGVMLDHTGPLNTCLDCNVRYRLGEGSVVLGISELTFDLSVWDIFGTLATGATLVLPAHGMTRDPAILSDLVSHFRVTHWNSVPQFVVMLTDHLISSPAGSCGCGSLEVIMMSGDYVPRNLPSRLRSQLPSPQIISMGGATEGSIWSIVFDASDPSTLPSWPTIPYGHGMANQRMYVLAEAEETCHFAGESCSNLACGACCPEHHHRPLCVPGEIAIAGVGVAQGYWARPQKTNAQFKMVRGEWTYLTGDMGRWRSNGEIEFLGRKDNQVKLQGFRVELGEVESAALKSECVDKAVAAVVDDRLICYCVLIGDNIGLAALSESVKEACGENLPPYMIPSIVMSIPSVPISANGKLDRKQLPSPHTAESTNESSTATSSKDATEHELRVIEVFSTILPNPIGLHQDFFECGGNSVLAVRLMNCLKSTFKCSLRVSALLSNRTPGLIASLIHCEATLKDPTPNVVQLSAPTHGSDQNVFLVHGIGGDVFSFQHLSRHLSSALPATSVYGLQASTDRQERESVSEIASRYLLQIRQIQPHGLLHLVGWSFGGHVCYEMALKAGANAVASLVFIDTFAAEFEHSVSGVPGDGFVVERYLADLRGQYGISIAQQLSYDQKFDRGGWSQKEHLQHLLDQLQDEGHFEASTTYADIEELFKGYEQNAHALFTYTPPTSSAEWLQPVLLKAADPPLDGFEMYVHMNQHALGWDSLVSAVVVQQIPGDHFSMVTHEECSLVLAERIADVINLKTCPNT